MSQRTGPRTYFAAPVAFIVVLLFLATVCCAAPLKQAALIPQWEPQAQFAGYYVALAKGFYTEAGVDLRILRGGPHAPPSELLRQGRAQFGTFFLTTALRLRVQGLPLVNLAQFVPVSTQLLVARRDRGIVTPADLNGKRVSLWGAEFHILPEVFFRRHGIRVSEVPQGSTVTLFLRGGADACSAMTYNEYHTLLASGLDPEALTVFPLGEGQDTVPEDGLYCLDATWRRDPDLCRAVARASIRGWLYAFAHPKEALDIVMDQVTAAHLPTNRMHQQWMFEHIRQAMETGGAKPGPLTAAQYAQGVAALRAAGVIPNAPTFEEFHVDIR